MRKQEQIVVLDYFVITSPSLSSLKTTDMRAIIIKDGKGPIENLYIGEATTPAVKSQEVLVKVRTVELRATYAPLTSQCANHVRSRPFH
jgi:hypothetical protein